MFNYVLFGLLALTVVALVALSRAKRAAQKREYEQLKTLLTKSCTDLAATLADAGTVDLFTQLNASLATLAEQQKQYGELKSAGASADQLTAVAASYGKTVQEGTKIADQILSKIAMHRMTIDIILQSMAMRHNAQLSAEKDTLVPQLEASFKGMDPLRAASKAFVPVLSQAQPAIYAREQAGEILVTDQEYTKAATAVLESLLANPATAS